MISLRLDKRGPPLRASALASTAAQGDGRRDGDGGRGSQILGAQFQNRPQAPTGMHAPHHSLTLQNPLPTACT
jgi:hypothetical protein